MVPVMGRLVAHDTCHRVKACKNFRQSPGGQTRGSTEPKLAGHMHAALT